MPPIYRLDFASPQIILLEDTQGLRKGSSYLKARLKTRVASEPISSSRFPEARLKLTFLAALTEEPPLGG